MQATNIKLLGLRMLLDVQECQLVLVDFQTKLMPAMAGGAEVIANAVRLAKAAQLMRTPIFITEQYPQGLGSTIDELRSQVTLSYGKYIEKMHFDATAEGLVELLMAAPTQDARSSANPRNAGAPRHVRERQQQQQQVEQRGTVVMAGCEAHICLLQTALGCLEAELDVVVVTDACASRTERNRDAAYDRLAAAGAELVTTEMVLFEWLRTAEHPQFKAVQALVK
jgi:nicotinamidase-related amidase